MNSITIKRESGAVSLFIVIFAMLIITVLTISFLRIMVTDQNQASATDLSQSAYDSAQAGVEDAKRALLNYQRICNTTPSACAHQRELLSGDAVVCNEAVLVDGIVDPSNLKDGDASNPGEVTIQQSLSSNDSALDQAYTCVKITMSSDSYEGELGQQESEIIPLIPAEGPSGPLEFNQVTVRWFSRDDVTGSKAADLDVPSILPNATNKPLLQQTGPSTSSWSAAQPSVMRVQLIQFGPNFALDSFDPISTSQSNANTVFLYPTSAGGATRSGFFSASDMRLGANGQSRPDEADETPQLTRCVTDVSAGGYACEMTLRLPTPIGGGNDRTAYLRLTSFYNKANFEVALGHNNNGLVKFRDVQPSIDSTGRANDLFRRVVTKVNLYDTGFPYPDATIDVTGDFCKDFSVTDTAYIAGSCTP